jgi:MFS family permease
MSDDAAFSRRYSWYIVWLLTFAYGVAILDRVVISLLIEPIKAQFQLSDFDISLLSSVAFGLCYSLMALPFGWLADRVDRRYLATLGVVIWSVAASACGLARNFAGLFLGRLFVGVGEAALNPCTVSIVADLFPPATRAKAYGVFVGGTAFGAGAAFLLGGATIAAADLLRAQIPWLSGLATWQLVFVLTALPGFVIALLLATTVREPPRRARAAATETPPLLPFLRQNRVAVGTTMLGLCFAITSLYALITWYPVVLIRVRGWSPTDVGAVLGVAGPPFALAGSICSGWLIAHTQRNGRSDAPLLIGGIGSIACGALQAAAGVVESATASIVFYALATLISNVFSTAALSAMAQLAPGALRGRLTALYTLIVGIVAVNLGPMLVGLFSDFLFGAARLDLAFGLAVMLTCALGTVILLAGRGAYRRSVGGT